MNQSSSSTSLNTSSSTIDQKKNKGKVTEWSKQAASNVINKMFWSFDQAHFGACQEVLKVKVYIFQHLALQMKLITQDYQPFVFGSAGLQVSLPDSDIDIVLIPNKVFTQHNILKKLGESLVQRGQIAEYNYVQTAKIPVLKFAYNYYNMQVKFDVIVNTKTNKNTGLLSCELMNSVFQYQPILRKVFIILKYITQYKKLHNCYDGGIGSYKLFIMIICFMEEKHFDANKSTLGQIIISFIRFYADEFDNKSSVLRFKKGQKCVISFADYYKTPKVQKLNSTGQLKMIDPINNTLIHASFKKYGEIVSLFKQFVALFNLLQEKAQEISKPLVNSKKGSSIQRQVSIIEKELSQSYLIGIFQTYLPYQIFI